MLKKILTDIILVALALGRSDYSGKSQSQPQEKIFPYTKAGQIAEIEPDGFGAYAGLGLAAADFDGDGDIDLAVMRNFRDREKVFLYKNEGGKYVLAGQIAEIEPDGLQTYAGLGLAAADFDGDGDIDLAVVRNVRDRGKVILYRNESIDKKISQ